MSDVDGEVIESLRPVVTPETLPITLKSTKAALNNANEMLSDKSPNTFLIEETGSPILLIEDDSLNITAMKLLLEQFNLDLSWAISGEIAIEMVKNRLVSSVGEKPTSMYKLILCDFSMPKMDGL